MVEDMCPRNEKLSLYIDELTGFLILKASALKSTPDSIAINRD
jgi:hypothetical protein